MHGCGGGTEGGACALHASTKVCVHAMHEMPSYLEASVESDQSMSPSMMTPFHQVCARAPAGRSDCEAEARAALPHSQRTAGPRGNARCRASAVEPTQSPHPHPRPHRPAVASHPALLRSLAQICRSPLLAGRSRPCRRLDGQHSRLWQARAVIRLLERTTRAQAGRLPPSPSAPATARPRRPGCPSRSAGGTRCRRARQTAAQRTTAGTSDRPAGPTGSLWSAARPCDMQGYDVRKGNGTAESRCSQRPHGRVVPCAEAEPAGRCTYRTCARYY